MFDLRSEGGYSLIVVLVAWAIVASITNGIMMVIFHTYDVSSAITDHIVAIREVRSAGHWITLDGQIAANIEPFQDPDGFPLTISWNDPDDNQHEVVYTLLLDNELQRQHYTNRAVNPDPDATMIVARSIDPSSTSCNVTENNELVASITAAVDGDRRTYTETRTYRVFPRQSLQ
ncbi:hypothetical protein ACFLYE_02415 [Chloroflexota bacterium]